MTFLEIPLDNSANQSFVVTLPINNINIKFLLELNYKELCEYWLLTIKDASTKKAILSNIPLLRGGRNIKASNILYQYQYLDIGSLFIVKVSETELDSPDDTSLGSEFKLIWSDNHDKFESNTN